VLVVGVCSLMFTASAGAAYVKNSSGSHVKACGAIGCVYGPGYMVPNGTYFGMYCWQDYKGSRWFNGYISPISGRVWVPARYVFDQQARKHC